MMSTRAMGHHLAWRGPKRRPWTDHVEVHTARSARRGAASGGRQLDGPWEDIHWKHQWTSALLIDTVPGAESKQEGQMMERWSSPARSMAPELNGGEGAGPSGWGAALGSGKALGPRNGERGGATWLSTDSVVGTEARCGGGSLMKGDGIDQVWRAVHGRARTV
jgi:hypothetical protein